MSSVTFFDLPEKLIVEIISRVEQPAHVLVACKAATEYCHSPDFVALFAARKYSLDGALQGLPRISAFYHMNHGAQVQTVRILLNIGASWLSANSSGAAILGFAAEVGNLELIKLMIQHSSLPGNSCSLLQGNIFFASALAKAAGTGNTAILSKLTCLIDFTKGVASVLLGSALCGAAQKCEMETLRWLLCSFPALLTPMACHEAFAQACYQGHLPVFDALIQHFTRPYLSKKRQQTTQLHHASKKPRLCTSSDADISSEDDSKQSDSDKHSDNEPSTVSSATIEVQAAADLSFVLDAGLVAAARGCRVPLLLRLWAQHAACTPNALFSALQEAAAQGPSHLPVVTALLLREEAQGLLADPRAAVAAAAAGDPRGPEALAQLLAAVRRLWGGAMAGWVAELLAGLAVQRGSPAALAPLLEAGGLDAGGPQGAAWLGEAAALGHVGVVRLLLDQGAAVHVPASDFRLLRRAARQGGAGEGVVRELLTHPATAHLVRGAEAGAAAGGVSRLGPGVLGELLSEAVSLAPYAVGPAALLGLLLQQAEPEDRRRAVARILAAAGGSRAHAQDAASSAEDMMLLSQLLHCQQQAPEGVYAAMAAWASRPAPAVRSQLLDIGGDDDGCDEGEVLDIQWAAAVERLVVAGVGHGLVDVLEAVSCHPSRPLAWLRGAQGQEAMQEVLGAALKHACVNATGLMRA